MNQVDIIRKQCEEAVKYLQSTCKHINATFKNDSDTGNWCKADDRYWKDYTCPDCSKKWRIFTS